MGTVIHRIGRCLIPCPPLRGMGLKSSGTIWSYNKDLDHILFPLSPVIPPQPTAKPAVGLFESASKCTQNYHATNSATITLVQVSVPFTWMTGFCTGLPTSPKPPTVHPPLSSQGKYHFPPKFCSTQNKVPVSVTLADPTLLQPADQSHFPH